MTNHNAALANEAPRPVHCMENRAVKGAALLDKGIHDSDVARTVKLRQRQAAYHASLPKDPQEALEDIRRTIKDPWDMTEPHYAPRAALEIVNQLTIHNALDDSQEMRDAISWLVGQGLNGLQEIEDANRRILDVSDQFHPMHREFKA